MKLTNVELRELYEAVVVTAGHPDPLGYMARALLLSEGDPAYADDDGRVGFMPVLPDDAFEEVGAPSVYDLQNNILATLAMEIQRFAETGDLTEVISRASYDDADDILQALPEARIAIREIVDPPLATVQDVVDLLNADGNGTLSKSQKDFYERLVYGNAG